MTPSLFELLKRPVVFYDTETSGVDIRTDRIVEIAAIRWDQNGRKEWHTLVDPGAGITIPAEATAKHGITRERLTAENAPTAECALDGFLEFGKGVSLYIAHNATFDLGLVAYELNRYGLPALKCDFICTNALALFTGTGIQRTNRGGYPMLGTKLEEVAQVLGLTLEGAHQAANDIAMTELIFPALYERAKEQTRPILNAMIHRKWLAERGQEPQFIPPRAVVYMVA